jgi:hypothetical protein
VKRSAAIYDSCTTVWFQRREDAVRGLRHALRAVVEDVPVPFEHHSGVSVAEGARDGQRILPSLDEKRVRRMPQTVECHVRQRCQLE